LCDFDGTLSPIVDDPTRAQPLAGIPDLLASLADRYRTVAVVSGRPVEFLERFFAPSVALAGLYGLELQQAGRRVESADAEQWRAVIDDIARAAVADGPAGVGVESKGLSLTLHYRTRPELADAVAAWATEQAALHGLEARAARMSVELHPPVPVDKGTAATNLSAGARHVCFVGDDLGDLAAFAALDHLAAEGVTVLRVAVASAEAPDALLERADLVVDGPPGVRSLLETLAVS
jgi:trehalose 6-phosphate phosphatase